MGDPTYEAMRAKERAEHERERAIAEAGKQAALALVDFFSGRAELQITTSGLTAPPVHVRFVRDK